MKTIECKAFSSTWGERWVKYLDVPDHRVHRTLRNLRHANPHIPFRVSEDETEEEYQAHMRHEDLVHAGLAAP